MGFNPPVKRVMMPAYQPGKESDMSEPVIARKKSCAVDVKAGETYYWCTCGKSDNQPFCNGAHKGGEFRPMAFTATENTTVYLCGCKHTKTPPHCDGSHKSLP